MRLFTGIDLPAGITDHLAGWIVQWRPHARVRWSRAENLHITTKFIGEWPEDRLDELKRTLDEIPGTGPISISLQGLGWFPNPHAPRIFWISVQGGDGLRELARATESALAPLGIAAEKRAYTPHLTLARVDPGSDIAALRREVAHLADPSAGSFEAAVFHLYESRQAPGGSVYTRLHTIPL